MAITAGRTRHSRSWPRGMVAGTALAFAASLVGACSHRPPPAFEGVVAAPTTYALYSDTLERREQILPLGTTVDELDQLDARPLREWLRATVGTVTNTPDAGILRGRVLYSDVATPDGRARLGLARSVDGRVVVRMFEDAVELDALGGGYYFVWYSRYLSAVWDAVAQSFLPTQPPRSPGGVAVLEGGILVAMDNEDRHLRLWDRDGTPLPVPESMASWGIGSITGLHHGQIVMLTTPKIPNPERRVMDATWAWRPGSDPVQLWPGSSVMSISGSNQQFVSTRSRVRRIDLESDGTVRTTTMRGVTSMNISPDDRAIVERIDVYDRGWKWAKLLDTYWNVREISGNRARPLAEGLRFVGDGSVWLEPGRFAGAVEVVVVPRPPAP
ncbi:MAG: hypothetical protein ACFCBV_04470 [Phycisphaerales bacterium]